jgi:hypothetical protein
MHRSLSRCSRIPQCGCSLKSLCLFSLRPQSRLSATPNPSKVVREASPVTPFLFINWGVTAACVYARPLNRSGFGLVTVFEKSLLVCIVPSVPPVTKHFLSSLRIQIPSSQEWACFLLRSSSKKHPHLEKISLRNSKTCAKPLCMLHRSPTSPSGFLFGLPPSLNSRRLARYIHPPFVPLCGFFPLATHTPVSHSVGLHGFLSFTLHTFY